MERQFHVAWGIPADEVIDLQTATASFATLQAQADSPAKNSIIVAEKNAARKTLVAKIRGLADFRLKNPIITNAQRIALGLHVRDTTPKRYLERNRKCNSSVTAANKTK